MYIRLSDNQYPLSEREIRNAFPNTSFPLPFNPAGYAVVFSAPQPEYDQYTQRCVEVAPVLTEKGNYEQAWEVLAMTPEELEAAAERKAAEELARRESMVLSMRQCRLQLLAQYKLDDVNAAINTMDAAAQIDWEYAADVKRAFPLVVAMQGLFQWTDAEMDQFFIDGAKL